MERTFVVNTTPELFSAWLAKQPWPPYEFRWFSARPGEWLSVQPLLPTGVSRLASVCTACVGDYDSGAIQVDGEYEALTFDLTPLAGERLEVVAWLVEPALLTPFLELLRSIAERWPEAGLPGDKLGAPPTEHRADWPAKALRLPALPPADLAAHLAACGYQTDCQDAGIIVYAEIDGEPCAVGFLSMQKAAGWTEVTPHYWRSPRLPALLAFRQAVAAVRELATALGEPADVVPDAAEPQDAGKTQARPADFSLGPTAETKRRAELFRGIKTKDPTLSTVAVARKATDEDGSGRGYTADDVRNAYRAMREWAERNGDSAEAARWVWERADRIR